MDATTIVPETVVKNTLAAFISIELETTHTFYVAGNSKAACAYIAAMRAQLSRWRALIRAQHKPVKPFKMLQISLTEYLQDSGAIYTEVVLKKSLLNGDSLQTISSMLQKLAF